MGCDELYLDGVKYDQTQINMDITNEPTGFTGTDKIPLASGTVVVTGDNSTRTVTLTGPFEAYFKGIKNTTIIPGWTSPAHGTDTDLGYFLIYDGETVEWSATNTLDNNTFFKELLIALAYYDSNNATWVYQREPHGVEQWESHRQEHRLEGTYRQSGGGLNDYVLDSTTATNRRPSVEATELWDEDLPTENTALPNNGPYTQSNLTSTGIVQFIRTQDDIVPLSGSRPYWNEFSGGTWNQTLISNNYYMSVWVIAVPMAADSNSQNLRYLFHQGQNETSSLLGQQIQSPADLNFGNLTNLTPEFVVTNQIILEYRGGNWNIAEVRVITGSKTSQSSSPSGKYLTSVTSDVTLTGLGTSTSPLGIDLTNANTWTATQTFSEVVQQSSTSTGRVTLKDSPGDEARIYWGSDVDEDKYLEIGAYSGVNNIDTKTRDLVILSDAGDIVTFDATTLQSTFDGDVNVQDNSFKTEANGVSHIIAQRTSTYDLFPGDEELYITDSLYDQPLINFNTGYLLNITEALFDTVGGERLSITGNTISIGDSSDDDKYGLITANSATFAFFSGIDTLLGIRFGSSYEEVVGTTLQDNINLNHAQINLTIDERTTFSKEINFGLNDVSGSLTDTITQIDLDTRELIHDGDIIADKLISDVWESASASTSSIYFQSGTWYIKTNNIDIASFDSTSCMNVYCNLVMNANNITDVGTVFVDSIDLGSQIITDGEMTGDWQLTTSGAELKVGADYFGFNDGIIRAQDWYGFTWTMDDFGGDFTGIYFATGQINFQAVGISIFDFDGGSGGQYHFRVDGDFHGNDIESVGTLSVDFIELVAPIEGDIITIKTRDDGFTGSNTLYLGNDANTGDAYLTVANTGHGESKINQDVRTFGSPTFAGLTVTGGVEFGTLDLTGSPFGGDIVLDVQGTTGPDGFPGQVTAGDSINLICGDGNDCYSTKAGTGGVFTLQFGLGGADLGGGSAGDDGSLIIQTRLATICEITTTLADFQGIDITTTGAITATNYTATSTVHTNTIKDYSGGVTTIDNDTVIVGDLDVSDLIEMAITTSTVGQITQDGIRIFHTFTPDDQVAFWNNIFIGENSGNFSMNNISSATHGTGNVGIGANTLDALTTGFYNFAIGTNAGSGITTGESNVNIGHQAGLQTTTGSSNVLIGRDAGVIGNKTSCVGIGRDTLRNSGSRSVGIGGFAGKDCTGTDNIFLGYAAGYHLTTDIDTLIIGNQFYADRATELSDSIIVGIMDAAKENQTLNLNANVTVSEKLMVDAYDTDEDFSNNLVVVSNADSGGINLRSQRGNTGDYHGIKFRGTSFEPAPNQFYKTGIFHVDNGLSGARGDLYLCVDNASDANNVDLTNVILKIKEGSIDITDAVNMVLGTTTGTQIGTATAQKLSFHGNTPIIQQTTSSQTPATFVANTSGISDDTGTWNGYTIGDLVAILQAYGLLA